MFSIELHELYILEINLLLVASFAHIFSHNLSLLFSRKVVSGSLRPHGLHVACQASLSFTVSQSLLRLMSMGSVMLSSHLILGCPLLLLPSIFLSIRVFSNELALCIIGQSIGVSASASNLENSAVATGLQKGQFQSQSRAMPKNVQTV